MYKIIALVIILSTVGYYHWSLDTKVTKMAEYITASIELDEVNAVYEKTMSEYNNRVLEYNKNLAPGALKQVVK